MIRLATIALLALLAGECAAHSVSSSYLRLAVDGERVTGRWDIALRDAEEALGVDADGDDAITAGELAGAWPRIARHALARLALETGAGACRVRAEGTPLIDRRDGLAYAVLRIAAACPSPADGLVVRYALMFDVDRLHRAFLGVERAGRVETTVLAAGDATYALRESRAASVAAYLRDGVWHIWIGLDHVLFVLTLLLPAMYRRRDRAWQPVSEARGAIGPTIGLLSAFTVAHSITLGLAATGLVVPPARPVEALIAVSVVLAALNNLRPVIARARWAFAFGFGLVHGFGFAGALGGLGLPTGSAAAALLAFNLGVEIGQMAIALAAFPILIALRSWPGYARYAMPACSAGIAAIGFFWLVERAFAT